MEFRLQAQVSWSGRVQKMVKAVGICVRFTCHIGLVRSRIFLAENFLLLGIQGSFTSSGSFYSTCIFRTIYLALFNSIDAGATVAGHCEKHS